MARPTDLQLPIALAFAAVIVGWFGTLVYVPLALLPQRARVAVIQHNHVESVLVLSEMLGEVREVRQASLLAHLAGADPAIDRQEQLRASAAAVARLQAAAAGYDHMPMTSEERARWERLRADDVPALVSALRNLETAPPRAPGAVLAVVRRGAAVDEALGTLVALNADQAQREAQQLEGRLTKLSWGYAALAAVGTVGAVVLLVLSLRALRRYQEATRRRVAELEAFAGQVSHDLRSPLQTVQLAVDVLSRASGDPQVQRLAERALAGVRRLDGMIGDLLQFARAGATWGEGRADVREVLASARERLRPLAERAGVELTFDEGAGQGGTTTDLVAGIAPVALETVVANLVENAIKYRNPDRGNRVEVAARAAGDRVLLTVADTGVGIAPDLLPRIFEPFVQGSRRPDSYGLGLAAVKRLVEAHRGTVTAASEEGRGTTFTVDLPRARGEPTRERAPGSAA